MIGWGRKILQNSTQIQNTKQPYEISDSEANLDEYSDDHALKEDGNEKAGEEDEIEFLEDVNEY